MEVRIPKDRVDHLLSRLDARQISALEKGEVKMAGAENAEPLPLDLSKVKEFVDMLRSVSAGKAVSTTLAGGASVQVAENGDVLFDHLTLVNAVIEIQKDLVNQAQGVAAKVRASKQSGGEAK